MMFLQKGKGEVTVIEVNKLSDAEAYLSSYQVVLLDLDDTLYPERDYVRSGYEAVSRSFPAIENMADKLWTAFLNGEKAIDAVLLSEGLHSQENVAKCLSIYRWHIPRIALYPEAKALLHTLREKGVRLGLITDGRPEGQRAKLRALGLEEWFEKIIITDVMGGIEYRKPNVAAFEEMQRFFAAEYGQMVYVGDNPKKDFIAPQKLGMDWVYFNNSEGLY